MDKSTPQRRGVGVYFEEAGGRAADTAGQRARGRFEVKIGEIRCRWPASNRLGFWSLCPFWGEWAGLVENNETVVVVVGGSWSR